MDSNAGVVEDLETIIPSTIEKTIYGLKLNEDEEMSEEEKEGLSPSMKEACGGKPIVRIKVQETDEDQFNEMAAGGIVSVQQSARQRARVKRQTGCSNVKVSIISFLR